jgi:LacI family transcriptional regulator
MTPRPTALVAATDLMALGALEAAHSAGLLVPEELSLVGFDGHEVTAYTHPPLATVVQDLEGMGRKAAELLVNQIVEGVRDREHVQFPVTFEARGSIADLN